MKSHIFSGLCVIILYLYSGCSFGTPEKSAQMADGFYLPDEIGQSSLVLSVEDPDGKVHRFHVVPYQELDIKRVHVYPVGSGYQVQINVIAKDSDWTKKPIVLVVEGKSFLELGKIGGQANSDQGGLRISASVNLAIGNKELALRVKDRLTKLQNGVTQ